MRLVLIACDKVTFVTACIKVFMIVSHAQCAYLNG